MYYMYSCGAAGGGLNLRFTVKKYQLNSNKSSTQAHINRVGWSPAELSLLMSVILFSPL